MLVKEINSFWKPSHHPTSITIVSNKVDLTMERKFGRDQGADMAQSVGADYVEMSALLGTDAFEATVRVMRSICVHEDVLGELGMDVVIVGAPGVGKV
jgi:hypothetical protein